jgi:DNA-binding FrmR family transcriptional regulator
MAGWEFHAHLESRKALLEGQLRGINKMLKFLPEDPDLRAVFMR